MQNILNRWSLILIFNAVIFCMGTSNTWAHPHVFIAQKTTIAFDDNGLAGFRIQWTFDEMFSTMISEDFDQDHNGSLSKEEVLGIKEKAFGYIASYNYYIQIKIADKPFVVKYIENFNAELKDGKLVYDFFIPCHVAATEKSKEIIISPYDMEYYSAIYFPDGQHLFLENSDSFETKIEVKRDMSTLIYFETVNPLAIFMDFRINK